MAKKTATAKAPEQPVHDATSSLPAPVDAQDKAIAEAFRVGNYAAVHRLSAGHATAYATAVKDMVRIDPVQVAVGAFAILVVATVALLTLH